MVEYTFVEYTDMIFLYGEARGNGRGARRLYQDRFPQRPTPSHTLFAVISQRLRPPPTTHRLEEATSPERPTVPAASRLRSLHRPARREKQLRSTEQLSPRTSAKLGG